MVRHALPCSALLLAGCLNYHKVADGKAPGDMLGTYQVTGSLDASTCGTGALGSPSSWSFEIKLTRFENDIYWLNGQEALVGDIASDGRSFSIVTDVANKISDPGRGQKGCIVMRHDDAEGKLSASGTDVKSFKGKLTYRYDTREGSDCSDWIGSAGAVETLPCSLSYDLTGERSADK